VPVSSAAAAAQTPISSGRQGGELSRLDLDSDEFDCARPGGLQLCHASND
jgi:hypothetical protein